MNAILKRALGALCIIVTAMACAHAADVAPPAGTPAPAATPATATTVPTPSRASSTRAPLVLDRIVAVVNNEVITRHDLDDRIKALLIQLRQENTPPPPADVLERQVLERVIYTRVQLQFAKETALNIEDSALDAAIGRIAEGNKISTDQLRQTLEKDGIPFSKFREDVRDEITLSRLREREVDNKVNVTEGEIDNLLAAQSREGKTEEYNLAHILVLVPENATPDQIRQRRARAEEALTQIKSGTDFRQVAASFSDASDAVQGGAIGWRELAQMPTLFADAVRNLKPGETSGVLSSPNGFHLLLLVGKRGQEGPMVVPQTHARHILIKTNELVSEGEAKDRLVKLKERLDNNADFAELARLQSEDGSASRGGDLGWLSPGDTVPEFEKARDALKPGEISQPIRSPFGWHLIQVLERRNQDVSQQQGRLRARQALRTQKSDEAFEEWVRQLRDKAFVEYRLEER